MALDLRTILLTVGLIIIAAIIFDGYRRKKTIQKQLDKFDETVMSGHMTVDDLEEDDTTRWDEPFNPKNAQEATAQPAENNDLIIAITLKMPEDEVLSGKALYAAFQDYQLKFGAKHIYHKHLNDNIQNETLFSVASLTHPGTIEPNKLVTSYYKGLLFFVDVGQQYDPMKAFESMIKTAKMMSHELGAELCDHRRNPLTAERIEAFKESILDYQSYFGYKEKESF